MFIDKLIAKHGFEKISENKYYVDYAKTINDKRNHIISISYNLNGNHTIKVYNKDYIEDKNGKYWYKIASIPISLIGPLWLKCKYMKFRYHWK